MGYSLRTASHISKVRSSMLKKQKQKTKNKKKTKLYKEVQTSSAGVGAEGEEGERASTGVAGSPEQSAKKDSSASSSLGISKLRSKPG